MEEENINSQPDEEQSGGAKESVKKVEASDKIDAMAILSYLGPLFLIPLLTQKEDEFIQFHAKQGMTLFLLEVATAFISGIPVFGWILGPVLSLAWLVLSIVGIMNVVNNREKELPVVGELAYKFKV